MISSNENCETSEGWLKPWLVFFCLRNTLMFKAQVFKGAECVRAMALTCASTIELLWGRKGGWGNAFVLFLADSLSFSILLMKWGDRWIASPHIRHTIKLERHGLLFGILNPYKFFKTLLSINILHNLTNLKMFTSTVKTSIFCLTHSQITKLYWVLNE